MNRRMRTCLLGVLGLMVGGVSAESAPPPADVSAQKMLSNGEPEPRFMQMHESFLKRIKAGKIGLLFLGDSITEGWTAAPEIWQTHYGKYDPANFGIGGDVTQNVLWRIEHGELDGIQPNPKAVVLMIGTNNMGYPTQDVVRAITKIVKKINAKLPESEILLMGLLPRGEDPADPNVAAMRSWIRTVNRTIEALPGVRYLDIGDKFLDAHGKIPRDTMPDALHPNAKGYEIWANAMDPLLDEMLRPRP